MHASRLRFSTAHLFYAVLLNSVSVSLFGLVGLAVASLILLIWWQVLAGARRETQHQASPRARSGFTRMELLAALMLAAAVIGLMLPARSDFDPMQQANNSMRQIVKAVDEYEAKHRCALPSVIYDGAGKPMHSWRALILAELGEDKLATAYRMDEPWNGPSNRLLLPYRPWHYRPFYPQDEQEDTLEGNRDQTHVHLLDRSDSVSASDHPVTTIFEHEQAGVCWLEPTSIEVDELKKLNQPPSTDEGFWEHGILVSEHRGRLAASRGMVEVFHPGCSVENWPVGSKETSFSGAPTRVYHFDTLLKAILFAAVTLYPIRWLRKIQEA